MIRWNFYGPGFLGLSLAGFVYNVISSGVTSVGAGGQSALHSDKFAKNWGKSQEKFRKRGGNQEIIRKKRKNREEKAKIGLPLLKEIGLATLLVISCNSNLYTVWNVLAKKWILGFLAKIFKKKMQKKKKKTFPRYRFLDHIDSFGKFLKFFVLKHFFFLPLLTKGPKRCFCRFLKNAVPCEFPMLKLCNFIYILYLFSFQLMTKTIFAKSYPGTKLRGALHHP